jgi:argininosuccinate synthase
MANPSTTTPATEQQALLQKTFRLMLQLMSDKVHGQVTITLRDGNIQLVNVQRAYLPKNLP